MYVSKSPFVAALGGEGVGVFSENTKYESIYPTVDAVDRDGKIVPTEYNKYSSR